MSPSHLPATKCTLRVAESIFSVFGGGDIGPGEDFQPFVTQQMINARIMADQVAMGTFIPGMPPVGQRGPTNLDRGTSLFPVGLDWIFGNLKFPALPSLSDMVKLLPRDSRGVPTTLIRPPAPSIQINVPQQKESPVTVVSNPVIPLPPVSICPRSNC